MFVQSDVQFMGSDVYDEGEEVFDIWYLLIWQPSTNENTELYTVYHLGIIYSVSVSVFNVLSVP